MIDNLRGLEDTPRMIKLDSQLSQRVDTQFRLSAEDSPGNGVYDEKVFVRLVTEGQLEAVLGVLSEALASSMFLLSILDSTIEQTENEIIKLNLDNYDVAQGLVTLLGSIIKDDFPNIQGIVNVLTMVDSIENLVISPLAVQHFTSMEENFTLGQAILRKQRKTAEILYERALERMSRFTTN